MHRHVAVAEQLRAHSEGTRISLNVQQVLDLNLHAENANSSHFSDWVATFVQSNYLNMAPHIIYNVLIAMVVH